MAPVKVTIVGSGNWGSAIARIVGQTTKQNPTEFDPQIAVPDLVESCKDANILIFVVPHQFVNRICVQLQGKLTPNGDVQAISLIKGVSVHKEGGLKLISEEIEEMLNLKCSVLMGANLAPEVAADNFCEATIGCQQRQQYGPLLKKLFHTPNFRINVVEDAHTVELCGALKNIVACAAGISDGLGYGDNTKAAVIRLGLMEMTKFVEHYYPGSNLETFFESCGIADLITTCYGGRNRKVCEAFVKANGEKTLADVEKELLNGQSAQGPLTAEEVYLMMAKTDGLHEKFPLFVAVHYICSGKQPPNALVECLRSHPEHMKDF